MRPFSLLLILALFGGSDTAASASAPRASSSARRTPTVAKIARVPARAKAASATKPAAKAASREAPRTLQDIHIEGEIPVPQVLFITARDQRRFLDFQHHRYLETSRQVGEQTVLPSWIGVTSPPPTDARKENPR